MSIFLATIYFDKNGNPAHYSIQCDMSRNINEQQKIMKLIRNVR